MNDDSGNKKEYRCNNCGYISEEEFEQCPICSAHFEDETSKQLSTWECSICSYTVNANTVPERCPNCGVGGELFEERPFDPEAECADDDVTMECSICGYTVDVSEAPERCPNCGVGGELLEEKTTDN